VQVSERFPAVARATLDPAGAFGRHPLQPHELLDRVTRTEDTIVLCHLGVPRIDPDDWSLSIDGLVRRPMHLTLSEIKRRPRVEITSIHQCCGSPLKPQMPTRRICNVVWGGVRLSELIADCGSDPAARYVWSSGADHGVFEGDNCDACVKDLPMDRVAADVLIAYEMNGEPLRPENGYPARLVVPGYYGTNSVKWLIRLSLADARAPDRSRRAGITIRSWTLRESQPEQRRPWDRSRRNRSSFHRLRIKLRPLERTSMSGAGPGRTGA
jgi:DMSO/TMAO reductase YedYZ molybdopterin-dependent catalytic subunit